MESSFSTLAQRRAAAYAARERGFSLSSRAKTFCVAAASIAALLVAPAGALADDLDGSGWTYNPGTNEIGLRVSNNTAGGRTLMSVDFDVGSGTVNSASTSGGSCTNGAHTGSCTFGSPLGQGQHANVFIETPGPKPASVGVTLHKSDASTQAITAGECPETQFPPQASLPDATATQPYSSQLADQGGPGPHYFSYGSGALPPLALSLDGRLSGTPPAESASTNPYVFFVNVYDGNGCPSFPKYSLKINDAPARQPQADMQLMELSAGLYFEADEGHSEGTFQLFPIPVAEEDPQDPGWKPFDPWSTREVFHLLLYVTNAGPDTATHYGAEVTSSSPLSAPLRYVGWRSPGPAVLGRRDLKREPPGPLPPGEYAYLVYQGRFGRTSGSVTFDATVNDVMPPDPDPSDASNFRSTTVSVKGRPGYGAVEWEGLGSGGDIKGKQSAAPGSKKLAAGDVSAAALQPVEIAVRRKQGKRCSWLKGRSGRFQKPSSARCSKPVFLRAKGRRQWRYHLRHAPAKGSYTVFVRPHPASKAAGQVEFGPSLHNQFSIHVR